MKEGSLSILPIPECKISQRSTDQVAVDVFRGWDVARPLFEAGCIKIALARLPEYHGGLHRGDTHWFHLLVQGRMEFRLNRDVFIAEPGDLICVPKGVTTQRTGLGPVIWLYIELEDTPAWAPLKKIDHYCRKYESADMMYILVRRIIDARQNLDVFSIRCALENSKMLLTLLKRELGLSSSEWPDEGVGRLISLLDRIRERPTDKWNRAAMAQKVSMSDRTLGRVFQRTFNMSPARMVISIRMDLATRLLRNTEKSLTEIASEVGYDSPFSFSRLFKKYVGVPPRRYRARAQEQGASSHV